MHSRTLTVKLAGHDRFEVLDVNVDKLVLAGWTARDEAAQEHHLAELEALGVPRPPSTPAFYPVSIDRLTFADAIQVSGVQSSGEVEFVMVRHEGRLLIGLGSDQTDRKLETHSITLSKQLCDKVLAETVWDFEEVAAHWDRLRLRAWAQFDGGETLYQDAELAVMLTPGDIVASYPGGESDLPDGTMMFSGTIPALGGVRPASRFSMELSDPVLGRSIAHAYAIEELPVPA